MDNTVLLGIVASILSIAGFVFGVLKWGRKQVLRLWNFVLSKRPAVPRETLRIVEHWRENWWAVGSRNKDPATQVVSYWFVTNVSDVQVKVIRAIISKRKTEGHVLPADPGSGIYGSYILAPGASTEMHADFFIQPPITKPGKSFKARLFFIDNLGNRHKTKRVSFRPPKEKPKPEKATPTEEIHQIQNPIEKKVASVLKSETFEYQRCNRSVGGLGSVETVETSTVRKGVSGSPNNPSIDTQEARPRIRSENATRLQKLYEELREESDQVVFRQAMLSRLDRKSEYSSVGYLILLVMARLGFLNETLNKARFDLIDDGDHGFSNLLWMIDGLLWLEHELFTDSELDDIERFLTCIEESTFHIRERLAGVRSHRLGADSSPEA